MGRRVKALGTVGDGHNSSVRKVRDACLNTKMTSVSLYLGDLQDPDISLN